MSTGRCKSALSYTLTQEGDADDTSLDCGRNLCLVIQAEAGSYDNIVLLCDRGELHAALSELHPTCPVARLWTNEHTSIAIAVWQNGSIIAGGIWQVHWGEQRQGYGLRCICATETDLLQQKDDEEEARYGP